MHRGADRAADRGAREPEDLPGGAVQVRVGAWVV